MGLNGTISPDFVKHPALKNLLLSDNNLTGTIPSSLTSLAHLSELDVSNNSISGKVPNFAKGFLLKNRGNPSIGSNVLTPVSSPDWEAPRSSSAALGAEGIDVGGKPKVSSIPVGVIMGSVLVAICGISLFAFMSVCYYNRKQQHFNRVQSPNTTVTHPQFFGSDPGVVKITVARLSANIGAKSENYSRASSGPSDVHVVEAGNMVISFHVLRNVTNNFSEESILGRGGFGTVYKGELHAGTKIAIK